MSFIFQSVPEKYDLRKHLKVGDRVAWLASRERDKMNAGNIIYFWLAGSPKHRGLYGWGQISDSHTFVDEQGVNRVKVECKKSFLAHPKRFIPSKLIQNNPVLGNNLLFRYPPGTNFLLTESEDMELRELIKHYLGGDWSPPGTSVNGGQT
ncbi:MAG: hypothetical protein V3V99_11870 [candidate division Zixibacteria bacterium]